MRIVSHIHYGHLTNLVNGKAVVTVIIKRRYRKYRIHHCYKCLISSHKVNQTLRIVEYRPRVMPTVPFGKCIAPLQRRERSLEGAVFVFAAHQLALRIKQVLVIHGPLRKAFDFLVRALQFFSQTIDAPVIISIFQRAGRILINADIIRHIAQLIIVLAAQPPG